CRVSVKFGAGGRSDAEVGTVVESTVVGAVGVDSAGAASRAVTVVGAADTALSGSPPPHALPPRVRTTSRTSRARIRATLCEPLVPRTKKLTGFTLLVDRVPRSAPPSRS